MAALPRKSARPGISPEYSAQPTTARPNPMLVTCIGHLNEQGASTKRIADQGCGRLRHLATLLGPCQKLLLVDTEIQLFRSQAIAGVQTTIREYIARFVPPDGKTVRVMSCAEFADGALRLDAIFSVATMDVVLPETRKLMVRHASQNLARGGHYVVVIPRNDSSILRRCTPKAAFSDGYVFDHHGVRTFYRNFVSLDDLLQVARRSGLSLEADLSRHKQVGLVFRR